MNPKLQRIVKGYTLDKFVGPTKEAQWLPALKGWGIFELASFRESFNLFRYRGTIVRDGIRYPATDQI